MRPTPKVNRELAEEIFRAGLRAVNARRVVAAHVRRDGRVVEVDGRRFELSPTDRVWIVGAGKASAPMAAQLEEILGELVAGGVVVVKDGHSAPTRHVQVLEASHPVPDERGLRGAEEVLSVIRRAAPSDLIFCVISGGGSALLPLPAPGLTLSDKQRVTSMLLACGATIDEINCVRKHLSGIKGGQLAREAAPRRLVTLSISDVLGDRLDTIASGPTAPDPTTYSDALAVLEKYGLLRELENSAVVRALREGVSKVRQETPKPGDAVFDHVTNLIVANNRIALQAAAHEASKKGLRTMILTSHLRGEAREVAKVIASVAWELWMGGGPVRRPACVLLGGETTVTLDRHGKGGRNQELALAASLELPPSESVVMLSAGTDGTDGPTDAAGAVVDGMSARRARAAGLDPEAYLRDHNSYTLFERTGELLRTGPTETNVMDVIILLVGERHAADEDRLYDWPG